MTMTDPIADMLTRIRNGIHARHTTVQMPSSKVKIAIAEALKGEGYIKGYQVIEDDKPQKTLRVDLQYVGKKEPMITGLKRVSRPGLRVYKKVDEIPRVYGGLGVAIVSTPQGVMSGTRARELRVGGEVICYVW